MASSTHAMSAASAKCADQLGEDLRRLPVADEEREHAPTTIAMTATAPDDASTASARRTGVGAGRNRAGAGGGVAAGDVMARA